MKSSKNKGKENLNDWEIYTEQNEKTKENSKNDNNKINETNKESISDQFIIIDDVESDKNNLNKSKKDKASISDQFLMEDDWESNEEFYKNKVLDEPWIKNNEYLNKNVFMENIPSYHYFYNQCNILENSLPEKAFKEFISQPNFSTQPNTKKVCRKGIHPNYMHDLLINLFELKDVQNNNHYNSVYSVIFKKYNPNDLEDFVPYFTGYKTLKESLPYHFLNEKGIKELKILLWMINDSHSNIVFCPYLIKLLSLLLIFCNKYETFEIMCKLLENERNIIDEEECKIRWHFKYSYDENKHLIASITQSLKELSPKNRSSYYNSFETLNFKIEKVYEDMCYNFFFFHINFYGIIRFLPFFLVEGVKSFYRIIYAIENEICEKKIKIKKLDDLVIKIRNLSKKINDIQELFNTSYKLNLTRFNNKFKDIDGDDLNDKRESIGTILNSNKKDEYYLPIIKGGNLLTDYEIMHLWEILPHEFKIKNGEIIYQASKDGYNLPNLIGLEEKYDKNTKVLFLIETIKGDKFGFISSNLIIHTDNQYQRPSSSFLFTIKPKFKLYSPIDSDEILYVTTKDFIFGNGSNGPAIQLNQDLKEGDSYSGGCFKNPCLVSEPDGHFFVKKLEVFKLE